MAMMDDPAFLISHIRNSFITSDETGMCELVIETDDLVERSPPVNDKKYTNDRKYATWHGKSSGGDSSFSDSGLESDVELSHSQDILPDMGFAGHRRRSNTAQRLEKLKREKHKQSKIKHVTWKESDLSGEDISKLFEKREVQPKVKKTASFLSQQLEKFDTANNPFLEYAKFDGKVHAGIPTKKIDIYLTMAPPDQRPYPMTVVTLVTAKVQELIGLILWQYTAEGRHPELKENLDLYALHIAEDDGEVDMDFPKLDKREPISKFGFGKLALVEKEGSKSNDPKSSIVVTINMPQRGFSKVPVDSENILMREILEKLQRRRKLREGKGLEYTLERQDEPGQPIDLDSPLCTMDTLEFCLVRLHSTRGDSEESTNTSGPPDPLMSSHYSSYRVTMLHRLRANTDVQLGISGATIEIDPTTRRLLGLRQDPRRYDMENIADCSLTGEKSSGKATFRLVYRTSHDYKYHDFEAANATVMEIVKKVKTILELRMSPVRSDYLSEQVPKLKKRHTIGF